MALSSAMTAQRLLPNAVWRRTKPLFERFDAILLSNNPETLAQRMSLFAFAIRIIAAAIAFLSQILLARWMGTFDYGIFVLVWTTMIIAGSLTCLGFDAAAVRFMPEYREKEEYGLLQGFLSTAQWFVIITSTVLALLGGLGLYLFSSHIENYYIIPFYLGLITIPMIAMGDLLNGVSRSQGWMITALSPTHLIRPVLILVFMVLALQWGHAPTTQTALIAAIAATWFSSIGNVLFVRKRSRERLPEAPREIKIRHWLIVALPMFLVEGFYFMLTNADVLMVGYFLEPQDVAIYFAAAKCLALIHFVYFAVRSGVAQRFASLYHGDATRDEFAQFARATVHWTFWPSLAMALIMLALGKPILSLFGPQFIDGYPLLFILTLGIVARAAFGPCESLLTMSGNERICVWIFGGALATNILLNIILIPAYGLTGAAIATAAAVFVEATFLTITVYKRLGILMLILPIRGTQ